MVLFVLVGFASYNNKGGQWPYLYNIVEDDHKVLAVDPLHKDEEDEDIKRITGVSVNRLESMDLLPYCVNVISERIEVVGGMIDDRDFLVVLSCMGDMEDDSSERILRRMGISSRNAYAFGLGCFAKPPNLDLLVDLKEKVEMGYLYDLEVLQRLSWLIRNNGCAYYRAVKYGKSYDWFSYYLDKLEMGNEEEVAQQYEKLCSSFGFNPNEYINEDMIKNEIRNELQWNNLIGLWDKRGNYNCKF